MMINTTIPAWADELCGQLKLSLTLKGEFSSLSNVLEVLQKMILQQKLTQQFLRGQMSCAGSRSFFRNFRGQTSSESKPHQKVRFKKSPVHLFTLSLIKKVRSRHFHRRTDVVCWHLHRSLDESSMPCLLFVSTGLRERSERN